MRADFADGGCWCELQSYFMSDRLQPAEDVCNTGDYPQWASMALFRRQCRATCCTVSVCRSKAQADQHGQRGSTVNRPIALKRNGPPRGLKPALSVNIDIDPLFEVVRHHVKLTYQATRPVSPRPSGLTAKVGGPLEAHCLATLHMLGQKPGMLDAIFFKARNKIQDPAKLSRLVHLIDAERWINLDTAMKSCRAHAACA